MLPEEPPQYSSFGQKTKNANFRKEIEKGAQLQIEKVVPDVTQTLAIVISLVNY